MRQRRQLAADDLMFVCGIALIAGAVWRIYSVEMAALVTGGTLMLLGVAAAFVRTARRKR